MRMAAQGRLAFAALLMGAAFIGFAPVFVKLALQDDHGAFGPSAIAFYRVAIAWPAFAMWMRSSRKSVLPHVDSRRKSRWLLTLAGVFFAADLAAWHWSIKFTTVANATLLANAAPLWVTVWAWALFGERPGRFFYPALALALGGAAMLLEASFQLSPNRLLGDFLGLLTAMCYGSYMLCVGRLRRTWSTPEVMAWSGMVAAPLLLLTALLSGDRMLAADPSGWGVLVGLALISHFGGQGLIAYSFGHLPASLSSVNLLLQPVVAVLLGWLILGESLNSWQLAGGMLVLTGLIAANRSAAIAGESNMTTISSEQPPSEK